MNVFISYTRGDRPKLQPLLDGLRRLGHAVWFDEQLTGGDVWWAAILQRIRATDVLLFALSPALLDSTASLEEIKYAMELGKPVMPVMVEAVAPRPIPEHLARLHIVDFSAPNERAAFDLVAAMGALKPAGPLPDPLPAEPPTPLSYGPEMAKIEQAALSLEEQLDVVGRLTWYMNHEPRADQRAAAASLLTKLGARRDITRLAADEIDRALAAPRLAGTISNSGPPVGMERQPTAPAPPESRPATGVSGNAGATQAGPQAHTWQAGVQPGAAAMPVATATSGGGFWVGLVTIVGLLFFAPLALVTVWFTPWGKAAKVIVAILAGLWCLFVIIALAGSGSSGG